jgi:hypothetical protein
MPLKPYRKLPCGCHQDSETGVVFHLCPAHSPFETDIDTANQLISEWTLIAASIAQHCKWRHQGQCLATCKGIALCNLEGLTLIESSTGFQPVNLKTLAAGYHPGSDSDPRD